MGDRGVCYADEQLTNIGGRRAGLGREFGEVEAGNDLEGRLKAGKVGASFAAAREQK